MRLAVVMALLGSAQPTGAPEDVWLGTDRSGEAIGLIWLLGMVVGAILSGLIYGVLRLLRGGVPMTIAGFQVVLLDEQGSELKRIPDVYKDYLSILVDDVHYRLQDVKMESGDRVRYFKRAPLARHGAMYCGALHDPRVEAAANLPR